MAQLPIPRETVGRQRQIINVSRGGNVGRTNISGQLPTSGVKINPGIINPLTSAKQNLAGAVGQAGKFVADFAISLAEADNENATRESRNITATHYAEYQESLRTNNDPDSYRKGLPELEKKIDKAIKEKFPTLSPNASSAIKGFRGDARTRNDIAVNHSANTRRINNMRTDTLKRIDAAARVQDRDLALDEIKFGVEKGIIAPQDGLKMEQSVNRDLDYYGAANRIQSRDPRILEELNQKNDQGAFMNFQGLDPQSRKVLINSAQKIENQNAKDAAVSLIGIIDDGRLDIATGELEKMKEAGVLKGWDLIGMRNMIKSKENETVRTKKKREKAVKDRKKFIAETEATFIKGFRKGQFSPEDIQRANIPEAKKEFLTNELNKYEEYARSGEDYIAALDAIDAISTGGSPNREFAIQSIVELQGKISDDNFRRLMSEVYKEQDVFDQGKPSNIFGAGGRDADSEKKIFTKNFIRSVYDPIFKQPDPWLAIQSYESQRAELFQFIDANPDATEEDIREQTRKLSKETVNNFSVQLITDTGLSTIAGNPIVDANFKQMMETASDEDRAEITRAMTRGVSKRQILDFANREGPGPELDPEGNSFDSETIIQSVDVSTTPAKRKIGKILSANKNKEFVKRILVPNSAPSSIKNAEGTKAVFRFYFG